MRLPDSIALVTGGGSGIGRGIAERFAREGARIVLADRNLAGAEETARLISGAGGEAVAVEADVADAESVERMAARAQDAFGAVTHLVNNAAIASGNDVETITPEEWDLNLAVVLRGVFLCTRAVLPSMIAARRGVIVNIASVNGMFGIGEEAYSAAKAGVINLTQNVAVKYGRHGIRANVICPGTIRTPIWDERLAVQPDVFNRLAPWYPLGRVGEIEDVVNAALFFASAEAAWITGAVLPVDGGLTAGSYRFSRALEGESDSG
jgi:NAD(P)-dependent dehydrogenase (short-subunit alcohol dehydrogenase family)